MTLHTIRRVFTLRNIRHAVGWAIVLLSFVTWVSILAKPSLLPIFSGNPFNQMVLMTVLACGLFLFGVALAGYFEWD